MMVAGALTFSLAVQNNVKKNMLNLMIKLHSSYYGIIK